MLIDARTTPALEEARYKCEGCEKVRRGFWEGEQATVEDRTCGVM